MEECETLIVGGGISGLACARRLCETRKDFLLVTDRLGGRMYAAEGPSMNFGAAYITSDYRESGRFVSAGSRIRLGHAHFWDGKRYITIFDPSNVRRWRAIQNLYGLVWRFRLHLNRLRRAAPFRCQAELMRSDPLLTRYTAEPATEFIARHRLDEINRIFADPIVTTTLFVPATRVNTFYYLAALMPILLPTFLADFTSTVSKLTAGFVDRIRLASVKSLTREAEGYLAATFEGTLRAKRLVLATPAHNSKTFCRDFASAAVNGVQQIPCTVVHIRGRRKDRYLPGQLVFPCPDSSVTVLLPLGASGCDLVYDPQGQADLNRYYEDYEIVGRTRWKTALMLSGAEWRPLAPEPDLFTIGDHNICGLEDSYLTGLFAANHVS